MRAVCLASSSAGNCYLLQLDCGTRISTVMVECGVAPGAILQGAIQNGINICEIEACLITHAHGDHCKSAKDVAKWGIPVYASKETLAMCLPDGNPLEELKPNVIADGVAVLPFKVQHDIEGAMGFVIKTARECVLFVNDCKMWDEDLSAFRFDYVMIECNYWHKSVYAQLNQVRAQLQGGNLPDQERKEALALQKRHERNINSHMSLAGTVRSLKKLDLSKCVAIMLMHLSDRYANEYEMKRTVEAAFHISTYVCKKLGGIK